MICSRLQYYKMLIFSRKTIHAQKLLNDLGWHIRLKVNSTNSLSPNWSSVNSIDEQLVLKYLGPRGMALYHLWADKCSAKFCFFNEIGKSTPKRHIFTIVMKLSSSNRTSSRDIVRFSLVCCNGEKGKEKCRQKETCTDHTSITLISCTFNVI